MTDDVLEGGAVANEAARVTTTPAPGDLDPSGVSDSREGSSNLISINTVESSRDGDSAGVGGSASFLALCTPGYYNNEGSFCKNKGELGSKSFKQNANFAGGPLRYYERMKTFYKDGKLGEKFVVF